VFISRPGRQNRWVLYSFALLFLVPRANPAPQPPPQAKQVAKELLEYDIEWRLVSAGRAKLTLGPGPNDSTAALQMKMHLESSGLVSRLFHVIDEYTAESSENYCAESTFMNAQEGTRHRETKVNYDASAKKATFREHDFSRNTNVVSEIDIPPCVHDVVSGLYRLRTLSLEPGKSVQMPVSDGKKSIMMKVECQRREEIRTPLGMRKALLCEIFAFNNVLYRRPGHLHVWLTDDSRKVPVQIQIRLQFAIGTITLRLDKDEKT
jgi:Protein of unknown function (DUF3108)